MPVAPAAAPQVINPKPVGGSPPPPAPPPLPAPAPAPAPKPAPAPQGKNANLPVADVWTPHQTLAETGAQALPIVAAAMEIQRKVEEITLGSIQKVGKVAQDIGKLDFGGLATEANNLLENFGLGGKAVAEFHRQLAGFGDALDQTAKRLAPFSAPLAQAQGIAEMRQVMGELRRARMLGDELSKWVEARSKLEQATQDAMAKLLKPLIPAATRIMERVVELLEMIAGKTEEGDTSVGIDMLFDSFTRPPDRPLNPAGGGAGGAGGPGR